MKQKYLVDNQGIEISGYGLRTSMEITCSCTCRLNAKGQLKNKNEFFNSLKYHHIANNIS